MRILLVTIPFYEYITHIETTLKNTFGAIVDVVVTTPEVNSIEKIGDFISGGKYKKILCSKYQKNKWQEFSGYQYDYILIIVGRGLDLEAFAMFLKKQKNAKKILYLWDDVARVQEFKVLSNLVDVVKSFDNIDSVNYLFDFLPLFFTNDYIYNEEDKIYDVSFTGWLHSDREFFISNVLKTIRDNNFNNYVYLYTSRLHMLYSMIRNLEYKPIPSYIGYDTISMSKNAEILKKSRIVLDIPHPSQNGLSIRTFEALASRTKLITTNKNVINYDFYNKNNILVVDRQNIKIDKDFLYEPYTPVADNIVNKYTIEAWLKNVLMC